MSATVRKRLPCLWVPLIAVLAAGAPAGAEPLPDPPSGFHGMLVLGTRADVYLVHLAMRSNPKHQFQLILRVDFTRTDDTEIGDARFVGDLEDLDSADLDQLYFTDRNHPDNKVGVYTFQPGEGFILTEIPQGKRLAFRGNVVRGHFERENNPPVLFHDVSVSVQDVVFFQDLRALDPGAPHPLAADTREFLLWGSGEEYFMDHKISFHGDTGRPDNNGFHQVLPVRGDTEELDLDLSARAATVEVAVGATDSALYPVDGGVFQAVLKGPQVEEVADLTLVLGPELYFEDLM